MFQVKVMLIPSFPSHHSVVITMSVPLQVHNQSSILLSVQDLQVTSLSNRFHKPMAYQTSPLLSFNHSVSDPVSVLMLTHPISRMSLLRLLQMVTTTQILLLLSLLILISSRNSHPASVLKELQPQVILLSKEPWAPVESHHLLWLLVSKVVLLPHKVLHPFHKHRHSGTTRLSSLPMKALHRSLKFLHGWSLFSQYYPSCFKIESFSFIY
ncbi:predicted protein [Candida tropicalis MYA-3404]|uniref:Uncharacterized protein n=1 Tax=Candida tropicalis (strain ATCC MYA-3404 / T1) TaxID=294747 RepID=C5M4P7_CANTT|nr:predicted protein [Candida tropicalis MYA-3404]EER36297.1 predicted protein [Candida tropicalis MYA-3404]KAG4410423.1 hypothetical protein JTP64_001061 [Candida tropicalis]